MDFELQPGGCVRGQLRVPGDKSISHRAVMLGSLAHGETRVTGLLEGEDVLATVQAFRQMGVAIEGPENGSLRILGAGLDGLEKPRAALDMGNAGTGMRLMAGILAGQTFSSELCGDASLHKRPMQRVITPLKKMGAKIDSAEGGRPPLRIMGSQSLRGIHYELPMASAQVKSAVLLAGLFADGITSITQPATTRDHTERMLRGFGYELLEDEQAVSLAGGATLTGCAIDVPADISSAAFFLVAASIAPDSELLLTHVGVNPTRTGVIDVLRLMGANIEVGELRLVGGEPVADIVVRHAPLRGIEIPRELVPLAIDEFPVLFIAAACADGTTVLRGAEELRVKESDRIASMAAGLDQLGVSTEILDDGIVIQGGPIKGGEIETFMDHRIAMAFSVAALRASEPIRVKQTDHVATSFPGFARLAADLGLQIRIVGP